MMGERVTVTATRYDGEPVVLHPSHDFGHLFCRACGATDGEPRLRRRCKPVVAAPTADEARGLDVAALRQRIRDSIKPYPDSSHGEDYLNSGKVSVLRMIADLAGDLDLEAPCGPEGDYREIGPRNWCKVHVAPMGGRWSCELAVKPWVWHDAHNADDLEPRWTDEHGSVEGANALIDRAMGLPERAAHNADDREASR